jgi:HAD superfamily hydrolase (TIGR01493 family)
VTGVIRGVLFDFSGTLFHLEPDPAWFDGLGVDRARVVELLTSPTAPAEVLPAELLEAWERRDLDPETHRRVYLTALRLVLPDVPADVLEKIYARVPEPASWEPYPDTATALLGLREAGLPVAVISNIPWDIREVFNRNGMGGLVEEYLLSYAEGVMKPDPKIFLTACQRIGVAPEEALMIGDSVEADGGATRVGCRFAMVARVAPRLRTKALIGALAEHRVLP